MPTYEFYCKACNAIDEVIRPMSECKQPYSCPECGDATVRHYSAPQVITKGEQIPYMHPAFGTIMTDNQAKEEAKRRGWVEVGNEDLNKAVEPPKRKNYDEPDYFL
jgi:putative FmdB family regulatory protein